LALFWALAFFASPFFFVYLEAEHLLGWSKAMYESSDPWLPLLLILDSMVIALALPSIIGFLGDDYDGPRAGD